MYTTITQNRMRTEMAGHWYYADYYHHRRYPGPGLPYGAEREKPLHAG